MAHLARLSAVQLRGLEDRYVDHLCAAAVADGHSAIIASCARGWIDLNRGEDDIDSSMVSDPAPPGFATRSSAKVRGGLGLIPRRIAKSGDIWRGQLSLADVRARMETVHRPYHQAVADALSARVAVFGCAFLLDLHSMPPLAGFHPPHLVIGDLFGRSAHHGLSQCAIGVAESAGFRVARNTPYAGGYILERHAAPHRAVHAVQLEVDRALYLDPLLAEPGPGLATMAQLVRRIAATLSDAVQDWTMPLAAE